MQKIKDQYIWKIARHFQIMTLGSTLLFITIWCWSDFAPRIRGGCCDDHYQEQPCSRNSLFFQISKNRVEWIIALHL